MTLIGPPKIDNRSVDEEFLGNNVGETARSQWVKFDFSQVVSLPAAAVSHFLVFRSRASVPL